MATDKSTGTTVDVLSSAERVLVLDALELRMAQLKRSANTAKVSGVADLFRSEHDAVAALAAKFRSFTLPGV